MRIDIITIFPEMFAGPFGCSIIHRACTAGLLTINTVNPRDFTTDKHHIVDDYPFGGGNGMVMKPEPLFAAVEHVCRQVQTEARRIILTDPRGAVFTQARARALARYAHLIIICGHYEGIDERVRRYLIDETLSIGDYVLTGGELPAMVITDAVARLLPGVLGAAGAAQEDSFAQGLLEYPQYTRPRSFRQWEVPEVLLSGDHGRIALWRRREALRETLRHRPELLRNLPLSAEDQRLLAEIRAEEEKVDDGDGC